MIKFQGTNHTFYIIGMNFFCTDRINLQQHLMKIFISFLCCKLFQFLTVSVFLLCLSKINIFGNCLYIKPGSTYQNRNLSFCINLFHGGFCHLLKLYNMKLFFRQQFIYQIMLHSLHFFLTDLSRANIHIFIYLHGICGNNFTVYRFGKRNREMSFSCCRRSGKNNQWLFHSNSLY